MSLPTIGFIGLGIMGYPMARFLSQSGYPVIVYNRTPDKARKAENDFGAKVDSSPRELTEKCSILITMVTNAQAIENIMAGPDGIVSADPKDLTWVQMSTLDIDSTKTFAQAAEKKGWAFLDCPVMGSKKQVESAQLIHLAGGEAALLETCRPFLLKIGKAIVHAGPVGAGTALKLSLNMIVAQMTAALAESTALARETGIDPAKIFEVIKQSPALDCGYYRIKESAILEKDYTPAFSLDNMLKDIRFMTEEARKRELLLPVTEAIRKLMELTAAQGHGGEDLTAIAHSLRANRKPIEPVAEKK